MVILVLLFVQTALGCICEIVPPPCYNYSQYETVFVGTVKSVKGSENEPFEKVEIDVRQNFKGMAHKTAFTYNSMTSCSHTFSKNDKFLFYGNLDEKKPDHFGTGYCTRTAAYDENLIDLDFLRKVDSAKPIYWVWGNIFSGWYDTPLPGINAQVFDDKKKLVGVSDSNGNIKIPVSKEGKYRVLVFLPKGSSINGHASGLTSDMQYWLSIFKRAHMRKTKPYVEFEVEVKPNKCGWFYLKVSKEEER